MNNQLNCLEDDRLSPQEHLERIGKVFATFDLSTNDSGNISFGVAIEGKRYFVKTAGHRGVKAFLSHEERKILLENAYVLNSSLQHELLPKLHGKLQTAWGPVLIFDWFDGELIYAEAIERSNPQSAYHRFRHLPYDITITLLSQLIDLHADLAKLGWIAGDFYDGCLMYHFDTGKLHVIDLDSYHQGAFVNTMGTLFGSGRFMAPEEFVKGAKIDEQTTVFNLAKMCLSLLKHKSEYLENTQLIQVLNLAASSEKDKRQQKVQVFYDEWKVAV